MLVRARGGYGPLGPPNRSTTENTAFLCAFTLLSPCHTGNIVGLVATQRSEMALTNELCNESLKPFPLCKILLCCISLEKRSCDSVSGVGRSGLTNMKRTYVMLIWLDESAISGTIRVIGEQISCPPSNLAKRQ